MSQCYICSGYIEEIRIDARDKKIKPCTVCLDVIADNLKAISKNKKPTVEDDYLLEEEWEEFDINTLLQLEKGEEEDDSLS